MVNIRPSELACTASLFIYYQYDHCIIQQKGSDLVKKLNLGMILKLTPSFDDFLKGKFRLSRYIFAP